MPKEQGEYKLRAYGMDYACEGVRLLCQCLNTANRLASAVEGTEIEVYGEPVEQREEPKEELKQLFTPWHYVFSGFGDAEAKVKEIAEHLEAAQRAAGELNAITLSGYRAFADGERASDANKKTVSMGVLTDEKEIRNALLYGEGVRINVKIDIVSAVSKTTK
nr:MAG TPA: hypothetical protein [Caudoviricetes sp.]